MSERSNDNFFSWIWVRWLLWISFISWYLLSAVLFHLNIFLNLLHPRWTFRFFVGRRVEFEAGYLNDVFKMKLLIKLGSSYRFGSLLRSCLNFQFIFERYRDLPLLLLCVPSNFQNVESLCQLIPWSSFQKHLFDFHALSFPFFTLHVLLNLALQIISESPKKWLALLRFAFDTFINFIRIVIGYILLILYLLLVIHF